MSKEVFTAKVGKTSSGAARLWIEGQRLAAVGFKPGTLFERQWGKGKLTLKVVGRAEFDKLERDCRGTVSGRGDKPIIDITGARVGETFAVERVNVTYSARVISFTK